MTKTRAKLFAFITLVIALSACGWQYGGQPTPPTEDGDVIVSPDAANVHVNQSVLLQATVFNSSNIAVTWSLSGAGCSGPTCGTISSTGLYSLYTAPASVPSPATVTVKATSQADTSKWDSATITILPAVVVSEKWTWVSGSDIGNQAGTYGTKGTAALSNVPGGRMGAVSWIDSQGKLWLFGGFGSDSTGNYDLYLNDLWKFDPTTLEWTWVSGSDIGNQAGTYGTKGITDPANVPGARSGAVSWIDSQGKLWLFGGAGMDLTVYGGLLNDLWEYDPTTNEWTWVSGSDIGNQAGTYGTKGTADPSNVPGARHSAVSWLDSSGKLWLFGGGGYDSGSSGGELNDLWEYDPATLEWTWVSGSNVFGQNGTYGIQGTADPLNVPGARSGAVSWLDSQGNLWLFGGWGNYSGELNDLWKYDPTTLEWTWVSGSNTPGQLGTYGTKGTAALSNVPGAREGAVSWIDSNGNLWLFGGTGYGGLLNDLWQIR